MAVFLFDFPLQPQRGALKSGALSISSLGVRVMFKGDLATGEPTREACGFLISGEPTQKTEALKAHIQRPIR